MKIAALLVAAAALAWGLVIFNRLVRLRNAAAGSWSDIDVQLVRRHDLVTNLVETVKGYASHERETLEEVVRARSLAERARGAGGPEAAGDAERRLTAGMTQLFARIEAYPDLEASERFRDLQKALVDLEDDIQNARRYYNAVVRDLNTRIQSVPDMLVAGALGFDEREFFQLEDSNEAQPPAVSLEETRP